LTTIYATIGAPASGKSTFINNYSKQNGLIVVCPDTIRERLTGSESNQYKNAEVFLVAAQELCVELKAGRDVCFDATNTTDKNRKIVYKLAEITGSKIVWHVFKRPLETLLKQNQQRSRKVPDDVIKRFYNNFTTPTPKDSNESIVLN